MGSTSSDAFLEEQSIILETLNQKQGILEKKLEDIR